MTEPQGQSGQTFKGGRERQETLGGRPGGAPGRHPDAEVRVPAERSRVESKRVHRLAALETSGVDPKKASGGCRRTRPVVEGRLAGARRRADRCQAIGVRGGDGFKHLAFLPLRLQRVAVKLRHAPYGCVRMLL